MRRDQSRRLEEAGIPTVAALAAAPDEARPAEDGAADVRDAARPGGDAGRGARERAARLEGARARAEARVRAAAAADRAATSSSTSRATRSGSRRAGSSTSGGSSTRTARFRPFWAHDRAQERRAVEGVIDLIREHRAADPAMHVYHYAAYEITALKRLTCEYGTREEELDELLRGEVFVDLYKVVSQGLRLSHARYGLKQVETFYFERDGRPARRRRLDPALRGLAREPRPGDPRRDRGLQRGGLPLDARAARLAPRAAARGRAAARAEGAARPARRTPPRPRSSAPRSSPGCPTTRSRSPRPTGRAGSSPSSCSTTGARRSPCGGSSSTGSGGRRGAPGARLRRDRRPRAGRARRSARASRSTGRSRSRRSSTTSARASQVYDPATGGSARDDRRSSTTRPGRSGCAAARRSRTCRCPPR